MRKFTKGPWEVVDTGFGSFSIDQIGEIGIRDIVRIPGGQINFKERKANAHLVAAAPEMFLALENLIEAACNVHGGKKWDAVILAKKIIKKANAKPYQRVRNYKDKDKK